MTSFIQHNTTAALHMSMMMCCCMCCMRVPEGVMLYSDW